MLKNNNNDVSLRTVAHFCYIYHFFNSLFFFSTLPLLSSYPPEKRKKEVIISSYVPGRLAGPLPSIVRMVRFCETLFYSQQIPFSDRLGHDLWTFSLICFEGGGGRSAVALDRVAQQGGWS